MQQSFPSHIFHYLVFLERSGKKSTDSKPTKRGERMDESVEASEKKFCPECQCVVTKFITGNWEEEICWNCGHYESNTPAYKSNPKMFEDMVRNNPVHFLRKYVFKTSDENTHDHNPSKTIRNHKP